MQNMAYKIRYSDVAISNLDDAYEYYGQFSNSALKKFKANFKNSLKSLKSNPFFQIKYKAVRALPMKGAPYIILFEIDEDLKTVYILSVFCTHQNPEKYP